MLRALALDRRARAGRSGPFAACAQLKQAPERSALREAGREAQLRPDPRPPGTGRQGHGQPRA